VPVWEPVGSSRVRLSSCLFVIIAKSTARYCATSIILDSRITTTRI
jgi:hypothetical protein